MVIKQSLKALITQNLDGKYMYYIKFTIKKPTIASHQQEETSVENDGIEDENNLPIVLL